MKKTIRILLIIAISLMGGSLLLMGASMLFQNSAAALLSIPEEIVANLPIFPVVQFLTCLLSIGCVALLFLCCGKERGGIWPEILILIFLVVVLPPAQNIASVMYANYMASLGSLQYSSYTASMNIISFCMFPLRWGNTLAYVICGMSIAYKTINKKASIRLNENHPYYYN